MLRLIIIIISVLISCKENNIRKHSLDKQAKNVNGVYSTLENKLQKNQNHLIGRKYKSIDEIKQFQGLSFSGIFPIGYLRNNENGHAVGKLYSNENLSYLIFVKVYNFHVDENYNTTFEILDVLDFTKKELSSLLTKDSANLFINSSYFKGSYDDEIISIAKLVDGNHEFYEEIYKAWRVDRTSEKIISLVTTKDVKVENEDYGP